MKKIIEIFAIFLITILLSYLFSNGNVIQKKYNTSKVNTPIYVDIIYDIISEYYNVGKITLDSKKMTVMIQRHGHSLKLKYDVNKYGKNETCFTLDQEHMDFKMSFAPRYREFQNITINDFDSVYAVKIYNLHYYRGGTPKKPYTYTAEISNCFETIGMEERKYDKDGNRIE